MDGPRITPEEALQVGLAAKNSCYQRSPLIHNRAAQPVAFDHFMAALGRKRIVESQKLPGMLIKEGRPVKPSVREFCELAWDNLFPAGVLDDHFRSLIRKRQRIEDTPDFFEFSRSAV